MAKSAFFFFVFFSLRLTPHALRDYDFALRVMRPSPVGSDDPTLDGHPRSRRDSGEDVEAGGSIGVDQVPELGGVGFARGFSLVEPEVYEGPGWKGLPSYSHDPRGGVSESEPLRRVGLGDGRGLDGQG